MLNDFGLIASAQSGKAMENLVAYVDERHRDTSDMVLAKCPTDVIAVPRAYLVDQVFVLFRPGVLVELCPFTSHQNFKFPIATIEKVILFEMITEKFEVPFDRRNRHFSHRRYVDGPVEFELIQHVQILGGAIDEISIVGVNQVINQDVCGVWVRFSAVIGLEQQRPAQIHQENRGTWEYRLE